MDLKYDNDGYEDEDEDVISPNSPLYEYFEQEDYEHLQNDFQQESIKSKQSILNSILNGLRCVGGTFSDICNVAVVSVYRTLCSCHNKVQFQTFKKVFNIVCEKKLLIPEDIVFIESFVPDTLYVVEDHLIKLAIPVTSSFILIGCFVFGNHIEIDVMSGICKDSMILNISKKVGLFAVSFSLSFSGWYFLLYCYHRFKCYCIQAKVMELCTNLNSTVSTFKKSFRIVQETEMIARGFASASAVGVAQRLELSTALPISTSDRQLPEYRKLLFSSIKDVFTVHRNATVELIESWPISTDCMSHYFATLELKEFGKLLMYDVNSDKELVELLKVSDNLSISSLKSLHQLMEVQISEFLRRYCLSLLTDIDPEDVNYFATFEKLTGLCVLLETILMLGNKTLTNSRQAYSYYRSVQDSSQCSDHPQSKLASTSSLHNFAVELHGLNLHLRATLAKVLAIEDYINEESAHSPNESPTEVDQQVTNKLNEMLNDAKSELSASNDCISECYSVLEYFERKSNPIQKREENPNWKLFEKNFAEYDQKLNFIGDSDPVIEDEVYEAITRGTDLKNESIVDDHDYDEKHKVDKASTAHLMRELKTILVVKAEEHREREQKALEAKASKEKHLKEDPSDLEVKDLDPDFNENVDDINLSHTDDESKATSVDDDESSEFHRKIKDHIQSSDTSHGEMHDDANQRNVFCDIFQQKSHQFHRVDTNVPSDSSENLEATTYGIADDSENIPEETTLPVSVGLSTLFQQAPQGSFAASIAALAAERQRKLNLQNVTYECEEEDVIEDDS